MVRLLLRFVRFSLDLTMMGGAFPRKLILAADRFITIQNMMYAPLACPTGQPISNRDI
ncbi:hypothetical protein GPL21_38140 [Bradyrhizobium pachyrhizi]|uniref:Uncharacterized protein n=1 Tax=Bradyrhizobium pachyrhizi TaxID=280333 RepID=A0A844T6Z9_9BRAD|nr:hypothetical protein [Bradyrhizobium pachyrhizi]MVT70881.1 hypothetical protein [Bradyrhizobium pachyrhizi]